MEGERIERWPKDLETRLFMVGVVKYALCSVNMEYIIIHTHLFCWPMALLIISEEELF